MWMMVRGYWENHSAAKFRLALGLLVVGGALEAVKLGARLLLAWWHG